MPKSSPDSPPPSPLIRYRPDRPVTTEYRVGLCAWQDKSMLEEGSFYPIKSMSAEDRLWWYSRFFDCVEVNSTFYAPLAAENAVRWVKRTPPGFLFSVKAYALLTGHHLDAGRLPPPLLETLPASARPNDRGQFENRVFGPDAREWAFATFREALQPLADAGKLGYVLFQMAPWVKYGEAALEYLASLPTRLPGLTIAVEFRDASWLPGHTEETLRLLTDRGLAYVSVDAPRTPAAVDDTVALTAPVGILRLHGRNREGFMKQLQGREPSVAEKYGYLYDRQELAGIVARGRALEGSAPRVYFKLNNNVGDAPAINGEEIKELLGLETADRGAVEQEWSARRRAARRRS
ncbi:MAG TPA: DUF72 domain-containing protein [Methylomirabilota bacterium]|nr:DUF72 domain-containing protein [Methylomirabilota bacterium]